jgi:carbon-monoxide dehydrogenase medium subunit
LKPPRFAYHAPATLAEALELLATLPDARPLAGGQSLMPMLNFRLAAPAHLVDLNNLSPLSFIKEDEKQITIGSMTRQRDIEQSALIGRRLPLMAEAIRHVGHRQTRNRGTLGGSLAHFDPAAELAAIATVLDAQVVVRSRRSERALSMSEFGRGLLTTALQPDEIITEIRFPLLPAGHAFAFEEFARRHGDFAIASAAVLALKDRTAIVLGGVGPVPQRVSREDALAGRFETMDDRAYPGWYRKKVGIALARRALERASRP